MHPRFQILLASFLLSPLVAQTSTASTTIDENGFGCQGPNGLLSGGVAASAQLDLEYNAGTGRLLVTVHNTTPIVVGEATAVITQVHLNVPPGAITSATLVGQVGSGGANPSWALSFDADTGALPNGNKVACFGDFNLSLRNGNGVHNAIANPSAAITTPGAVIGPVTFEIDLDGPGRGGIEAETILASFSQNAPARETNAAMKFQSAGLGGEESGFVGAYDPCRTAIYTVGNPSLGQTIEVCVTGQLGCHVCLWASETPGPFVVGPFTIPVGLPLLAVFDLGDFGINGAGNVLCFPATIPNDPSLINYSIYFTNLTYFVPNPTELSFSAPFTLTIQP